MIFTKEQLIARLAPKPVNPEHKTDAEKLLDLHLAETLAYLQQAANEND
jgi:hypothetical protein